jgi:hypothetical protein
MNVLELKTEILNKLKSIEDVGLLKQIMGLLEPVDPNEILHLNENELEMAKEIDEDEDIKIISQEQLDKEDSDWLTEL